MGVEFNIITKINQSSFYHEFKRECRCDENRLSNFRNFIVSRRERALTSSTELSVLTSVMKKLSTTKLFGVFIFRE